MRGRDIYVYSDTLRMFTSHAGNSLLNNEDCAAARIICNFSKYRGDMFPPGGCPLQQVTATPLPMQSTTQILDKTEPTALGRRSCFVHFGTPLSTIGQRCFPTTLGLAHARPVDGVVRAVLPQQAS